ncbi:MAG TPA: hypothetical protein PLB52_01570 [Candidatus Moranbacteria bacterium]|nr:hypothetical protein [Candidatus Moranbacteria bacterium]
MKILINPQGKPVGKPKLLNFSIEDCEWDNSNIKGEWVDIKPNQEIVQKKAIEIIQKRQLSKFSLEKATAVLFGEYNLTNKTKFPSGFYTDVWIAVQFYKS